ncbi:MAG: ABC transporter permease [Gemmatimonadaceae bacterium]
MSNVGQDVGQDVRYGIRILIRARGFTAVAVTILGLGIGATTTLFSAINGVLRRPLPYDHPDRLVAISEFTPGQLATQPGTSAANFADWRELNRTFSGVAAYRRWGFVLGGGCAPGRGSCEPERVLGARASANLFSLLGVRAVHGRTFLPDEDGVGRPGVALVSEELWRRRFGTDSALIGRSLRLNGNLYTVVGIVPLGFELPEADVWVPLSFAPYELDQRGDRALTVVARLRSDVGLTAAREDMNAVARTLRERYPTSNAGWDVTLTTLQQDVVGDARTTLLLLFAATGAVLLVACANLANLTLARSAARRRELAVRAALGAGRMRLLRQLATESMLTVMAGAALGLLIASAGTELLARLGPELLPRTGEIRIDAPVLGFVLLVSAATGLGLATIPALGMSRLDLIESMKVGAVGRRQHRGGVELRDLLVVGQVATALLLLVGGGLLARSFIRAQSVDLGFSPGNVLSMTVSLPNSRYPGADQRAAFFQELTRRVEALRGIRSAGFVSHLPLAGNALSSDFTIEGRPPRSSGEVSRAQLVSTTPGYFRTMGTRVVRGRSFADGDRADGRPVVMVDEALARASWPGEDAIGRRVRLGATIGADTAWREIVGVVSSVRAASVEQSPEPTIYVPHAQNPWPTMSLVIHTATNPARFAGTVRAEVLGLDPDQPVYSVRSMEQVVGRALARRRFQTLLLGGFAASALLLAVVGVYGVLAYAVAQRTRELGIRVALGAQRYDVLAIILRQALTRIGAGLLIGGAAALAGSRVLTSVLFEVSPWDPAAFAGAVALLSAAGLVASYLPARRAAAVDPVSTLRRE